jgi:hypothetical protein
MRRRIGLLTVLVVASFALTGCAGPSTFTVDGTWQFESTEANPIVGGPCIYASGAITVSSASGKVLGKAHVTDTDFGDVAGYAVCNVQFRLKGVPDTVKTFTLSVPGYDDPKKFTQDDAGFVEVDAPES